MKVKREQLKADLTLLKRYISEIEKSLDDAYKIRDSSKKDLDVDTYDGFTIALSKVVGLLAGLSSEAGFLIGDLQKIVQYSAPTSSSKDESPVDILKNILSSSKGGRGEN